MILSRGRLIRFTVVLVSIAQFLTCMALQEYTVHPGC
jgi:hypothetical protein